MSRFRLAPSADQEIVLQEHCAHARFVWNLAVEQHSWWCPGRGHAPGFGAQAAQLTQVRQEYDWLRAGSQMVQQQALRDFDQAMRYFFASTHGRPTWRKAGRNEGFRIVAVKPGHVRRVSRRSGQVWIPKAGWVRFRWSRAVPAAKSYRVTADRAGRWHIAFAVVPDPIPAPGTREVVGIDRGVVVSAALSTGQTLCVPRLSPRRQRRLRRLQRKLSRARKGSNRRRQVKVAIARLRAREADVRKDWAEMEDKAPGRVEKVSPAFTSQRCSACGHIAAESRKSQALFACVACGYACNADVNAARNIAAGHAVTARGGVRAAGPVNREPHLLLQSA
jgi:transposase